MKSDLSAEIAGLLARGFLRLTQLPRNVALSRDEETQKELDVPGPESPHVSTD